MRSGLAWSTPRELAWIEITRDGWASWRTVLSTHRGRTRRRVLARSDLPPTLLHDEVMAHALQSKLPFEIVRLIEEHVAAMVLQTMVWRWRGRRMRAEARNRRENEWELRVECYIGSFAYGHQPMTNPMNGWSKEEIAWFQRYSRSSFERYSR